VPIQDSLAGLTRFFVIVLDLDIDDVNGAVGLATSIQEIYVPSTKHKVAVAVSTYYTFSSQAQSHVPSQTES
jgi:hypothetical protein